MKRVSFNNRLGLHRPAVRLAVEIENPLCNEEFLFCYRGGNKTCRGNMVYKKGSNAL